MSEVYAIRDEEGNLVNGLTGEQLNQEGKVVNYGEGRMKLAIEDFNPKLLGPLDK